MRHARFATLTSGILALVFAFPAMPHAQEISPHARAKAEVETRDAKKHNKAKTELIPTAGGAVAGGLVGGPPGAFLGAKTGHTVGSVFHGLKKRRAIKKQERLDRERDARYRAARHTRRTHRRTLTTRRD